MSRGGEVSAEITRKYSKELHAVDSDVLKSQGSHVHYVTILDHKKMRFLVGS